MLSRRIVTPFVAVSAIGVSTLLIPATATIQASSGPGRQAGIPATESPGAPDHTHGLDQLNGNQTTDMHAAASKLNHAALADFTVSQNAAKTSSRLRALSVQLLTFPMPYQAGSLMITASITPAPPPPPPPPPPPAPPAPAPVVTPAPPPDPAPAPVETPAPVATPTPAPAPQSGGGSDATSTNTADWDCIRVHESSDQYNSPNAPSGAYGIIQSTWQSYGYSGWPYQASAATQDQLALQLYNQYGWQPWSSAPACGL